MIRFVNVVRIASTIFITSLSLLACESILQEALRADAPGNLEADDGESCCTIGLEWTGVADDPENSREVVEYRVERTPTWSAGGAFRYTPGTSYRDTEVTPAVTYEYVVYAVFNDGTESNPSFSDRGYALDATTTPVFSAGNSRSRAYNAVGTDQWFTFLGQKGWRYTLTTATTTSVALYRKGDIRSGSSLTPRSQSPGTTDYKIPASGLYHIRLTGGTGKMVIEHR